MKITINIDSQMRLDKALTLMIPDFSRSKIQSLIKSGAVRGENYLYQDPDEKVNNGEIVYIDLPPPPSSNLVAKEDQLDIVFEDEYLMVINKPAGLTVHPGAGNWQDTLANILVGYLGRQSLSSLSGSDRPGIVHRLDRHTSGLLIIAKNDIIHYKLAKQLAARQIDRRYYALIWGKPLLKVGTVNKNLAKSRHDHSKVITVRTGGKEAITHYQLLASRHDISAIECKLETGRTHQIRVHMASIGHNIIGDPLYGTVRRGILRKLAPEVQEKILAFKRQALHAYKLRFIHPIREEEMSFTLPLPQDITELLNALLIS